MNSDQHPEFELDVRGLRRAFDRASATYDQAAVLQTKVRAALLDRLQYVKLKPAVVLDAGCGTGHSTRALKSRFRSAQVIAMDIAPGMLRATAKRQGWLNRFSLVCADTVKLPFASASVDLIFSSLMLQWCNDLDAAFAEFRRVLKPNGLVTFTTFGPDTLKELRAAWRAVDDYTHVNRFIDMHDVGDAMMRAGLAEPVLDVEHFTLTYDDPMALMRDLKSIGAHNVNAGRAHGLTGRSKLRALSSAYEHFRRDGKLPATYEVVFGQAWGRAAPMPRDGTVNIPVDKIGRRTR